jgi:hypothetical protein
MFSIKKIKMAANFVENIKYFRRYLGLSRHFDLLVWQHCLYFILASELQHIKK